MKTELTRFDKVPDRLSTISYSNMVGNAGLVFQPLEALSFRLQYSQGFRAPDLASKITGTNEYLLPNYELTAEKSETYEFGVRYYDGGLFLDASVYSNKIDNYIKSRTLGWLNGHLLSDMINAASYKVTGFELAASWRLGDTGFTPYGSYSYLDGKITVDNYSTKNVTSPKSWGNLGLRYDRPFSGSGNFFADFNYRASGGFKEELTAYKMILYQSRSGRTMDLALGAEWGEPKLKLVVSVKNLLDEEYQPAYYGYPGRHVVATASYIF
jgi:outer membrane receptor protein involved in Fe transport